MRKRKSPIVLVTALVVLVAGVAGFNYGSSRMGAPTAEQPPAAPPVADDHKTLAAPRSATSTDAVANSVKQQMGSPSAAGGPKPMERPGPPGQSSGPMVLNSGPGAGAAPQKPKPNATSTSSQWYNDESANGAKKD